MSVESKQDQQTKAPIPPWAWVFAVACGVIPVLTRGGAIPGSASRGTPRCAWVGVIVLAGGLALLLQR
jgi:hypothetical protein